MYRQAIAATALLLFPAASMVAQEAAPVETPTVAVATLEIYTEIYAHSRNACDRLAETYLHLGNAALARKLSPKALAVQPDYPNAKEARRIVEGKTD